MDAERCVHELQKAGFQVQADVVATPGGFVAHLGTRAYDVILANYLLPGWTGMEALRTLQNTGSDIPLILVTRALGDERAVECVQQGAADYIIKDNLGRLPAAVRRVLQDKRLRDEQARNVATEKDVTQSKPAEQLLGDREDRFRQLAENMREVFFVMDAHFRETLYINPAYEEIWGRSCQSLYDKPSSFLEPIPLDDRKRLVESILRNQRGEITPDIEFRVTQPNGDLRWVLAHAAPIRDEHGEVYRISGMALDITERRSAQEALAVSEARYRTLTDASFDGIAIVDEGIVCEANRGFAEMFGYEVIDVIGRAVADFVAEGSLVEVRRHMENQVDGSYELVGKRKDGREIILEATAKTHEVAGRPERVTALRDITEKRQLENHFRQAQKMEAVGRLAGGVAHDFNNLLTVIISYTELLSLDVAPNDPVRGDLDQIRKAADAAAALTRQLLAFSRQQLVQPRAVRLEDVVANAEGLLKRLVGDGIEVVCALNEVPSTVMIDPGQLEQVLMNLGANARDAMPTAGKLTIETSTVDLDETYVRTHYPATPGHFAVLAVSDTGVGMDSKTQAQIFEPFFTTKEVGRGTGLGLATVYGIVKQSAGFIWVYSEPGKGTTFKIYLPIVQQPATRIEHAPVLGDVKGGTETVLVVEDAPTVRSLVLEVLARYGYTVLEAVGSLEALDMAKSHDGRIDLLLTDVVMPELSGRELAERLADVHPEMRVLYMSGYADDAVMRHGVLTPGAAFVQKPFTPAGLALKVRDLLDAERPVREHEPNGARSAGRASRVKKKRIGK